MNYKLLALPFLIGVIYYSINWICSSLYDNGYDIFKKWNKKKKKRS
jgi:hypothetical protein